MAIEFTMPKLGLTMTEGTVVEWLKREGEEVKKGEPLVVIMTDKANIEVEAPASGILRKILVEKDANVPVGTVLAVIADVAEMSNRNGKGRETTGTDLEKTTGAVERIGGYGKLPAAISPRAKKLATELGLTQDELLLITGSGPDGRIVEKDVHNYFKAKTGEVKPSFLTQEFLQEDKKLDVEETVLCSSIEDAGGGRRIKEILPLTGLRKTIAIRMTESAQTIPQFDLSTEVDCTFIKSLKEKLSPEMENIIGLRLSYTEILIKAVAHALRKFPEVNASYQEGRIVYFEDINIGIAVAIKEGLVVPVLKNADRKSLSEIVLETKDLVKKAREGRLSHKELRGGTFTLSNLGMFDVDKFRALINPPECAILATGKIRDRVVVEGRKIRVKPTMYVTITADHRVVDGAVLAKFLHYFKSVIENPALLLL